MSGPKKRTEAQRNLMRVCTVAVPVFGAEWNVARRLVAEGVLAERIEAGEVRYVLTPAGRAELAASESGRQS